MAYYVDMVDGKEVRTLKGRGRTKKGYIETTKGIWKRDPNFVEESAPQRKKVYVFFDDEGNYKEHKEVGKGRRPSNCVKCFMNDDGTFEPMEDESIPVLISNNENDSKKSTTAIVKSDEHCTIDEFVSHVACIETSKSPGKISLIGCSIKPDMPISWFKNNREVSRIDISNGDISIWNIEYREGNPDVIITNAISIDVGIGA